MKIFLAIILTLIIGGGLIGGGTYYFMNKKVSADKNTLQSQIDDLNAKISAANKTATTTSTSTATAPTVDPSTVVTSFYNWYNDGSDHSTTLASAPGGSAALQTWYNTALSSQGTGGGANPIVCAQDIAPSFTATTLTKTATAATVQVTENFQPAEVLAVVLKASGNTWLLSSITCPAR